MRRNSFRPVSEIIDEVFDEAYPGKWTVDF